MPQVEALESGVFRSDLPARFKCHPAAYQVGCYTILRPRIDQRTNQDPEISARTGLNLMGERIIGGLC